MGRQEESFAVVYILDCVDCVDSVNCLVRGFDCANMGHVEVLER